MLPQARADVGVRRTTPLSLNVNLRSSVSQNGAISTTFHSIKLCHADRALASATVLGDVPLMPWEGLGMEYRMLAVFTVALALGGYQYKAEPMPIAAYNLYSSYARNYLANICFSLILQASIGRSNRYELRRSQLSDRHASRIFWISSEDARVTGH